MLPNISALNNQIKKTFWTPMLVLLALLMYYHWQVVIKNYNVILKSNTLISPFWLIKSHVC